jgi:hypothetical protein
MLMLVLLMHIHDGICSIYSFICSNLEYLSIIINKYVL